MHSRHIWDGSWCNRLVINLFSRWQIMLTHFSWVRVVPVAMLLCGIAILQALAAEPTFDEEATRRFRESLAADSSGVAALVARDGKIVFQGGFGLADIENKTPVTTDTKFRIGSITKQFTAAAILKLAEQGKLSLDDTLDKYYPDFPRGSDVTIKQLMTHTSGIHSYTDKKEFLGRVKQPIEPAKLIEWFKFDLPDFVPGKGFHYNNSAYFLLGEIVAQVSGKSFADHLRETFFEPLGMKNTGIFVNASPPSNMALGYSLVNEKLEPSLDWDMTWAGVQERSIPPWEICSFGMKHSMAARC